MKLYGTLRSPFVRHCRIALLQGGFDWEMCEVEAAESARTSPVQKVPYLEADGVFLSDSCSILKYLREKSGASFPLDVADYELFCMTNTLMDASVNLFLLEQEGFTPREIKYLKRQANRVQTGLQALNQKIAQTETSADMSDGQLRLACYLDWALFRERIDIKAHAALTEHLARANRIDAFAQTSPRA